MTSNSGSPKKASAPCCSSSTIFRRSTPAVALETPPKSASSAEPGPVRYWSTSRKSGRSNNKSFFSSQNLNTRASTLCWVSFNPSARAKRSGPKDETVARNWTPLFPVRLTNSTGFGAGVKEMPHALTRSSILGLETPGAESPLRSPLRSAKNAGTPAAESCPASDCSVFVFPVPVAPAISPWRFIIASGTPMAGGAATLPSRMGAPRRRVGPSTEYPPAMVFAKSSAIAYQSVTGGPGRQRRRGFKPACAACPSLRSLPRLSKGAYPVDPNEMIPSVRAAVARVLCALAVARVLCALAVATLLIPSPAAAGKAPYWLVPGAGYAWLPNELPVKPGRPQFGLILGARVSPHWAAEAPRSYLQSPGPPDSLPS